ncbi:MAG: universal stress protein [Dehalococcoidia bacterium]|nr:universal stress protein [Dehalococcoidia bacterium]MDW8120499.1 universal stress protein [Chloroflexota bacterium]
MGSGTERWPIPEERLPYRRILLPVKEARADSPLFLLASSLARQSGARVFLVYIIEVPRRYPVDAELPEETRRGEQVLQQAESLLRGARVEVEADILQARDAGPAIVKEAVEQGVDLILMELPYRQEHGGFSVGHTTLFVLEHAPCPVLVLRQPKREEASPPSDLPRAVSSRRPAS